VASDEFGQIFITDTNRDHIDQILSHGQFDYKLYTVDQGNVSIKS
jgi:DNA replication and repair protein RecF